MKLVLLKKDKKLGDVGSIVEVKDGYARNYLIPQGIAALGTKEKIILAKRKISREKEKSAELEKKVDKVSKSVKNRKFKIAVKTSSGGRTFAGVSKSEIEDLIAKSVNEKGGEVKVELDLPQPIKEVGKYSLDVIFHSPDKKEKAEIILDVVSK